VGKIIQSTSEYSLDSLTLMIALNEKDQANGKMYVDKGEGFGYQKGEFSIFEFTAEIKDNELIVELKNSNSSFNLDISKLQINLVIDEKSVSDKIKLTYPVQSYLKN
jgi:alpha-glucosidase